MNRLLSVAMVFALSGCTDGLGCNSKPKEERKEVPVAPAPMPAPATPPAVPGSAAAPAAGSAVAPVAPAAIAPAAGSAVAAPTMK